MEPSKSQSKVICDYTSSSGKGSAQTEKNLSLLPDIVLLKIFSNLPYFPDVFHNISSVCKRFNSFCNDAFLPHQLIIDSGMLCQQKCCGGAFLHSAFPGFPCLFLGPRGGVGCFQGFYLVMQRESAREARRFSGIPCLLLGPPRRSREAE